MTNFLKAIYWAKIKHKCPAVVYSHDLIGFYYKREYLLHRTSAPDLNTFKSQIYWWYL